MGAWNTAINGNDTFLDVYRAFFDLYNQGRNPIEVSKQVLDDLQAMFNDHEDRNNSLFALALAQWETKSLDHSTLDTIKTIVKTDDDIKLWKELGADESSLAGRKTILEKFLAQISTEREKPKRRKRDKSEFEVIELVNTVAPDDCKKFIVNEEFRNKKYIHTSGLMSWKSGGGSILYFSEQAKNISAKWLDSQTLEVTHDKNINFTMKKETFFFCGDQGVVIYVPK